MDRKLPGNLDAAAKFGLKLLDEKSRREVSKIGIFNPHMKYETDFMMVIGGGLGIVDRQNIDLLRDIENNHSDQLHFLELQEGEVDVEVAMRIVMAAISREALKKV
ncbi:hypothetical protein [Burkholderia sp. S-53]|uniref:hypothetical protein n=1 Tax=Burkholderia sp. S-53 TaxID=2906514 RepID=UPI0021D13A47|nr:hypothetical protein [Burkholderia sp. S-53]UXU87590.1 hypothetical protein LXM88_20875 [Burkholderia sp. S-53]